MKKLFTFIPLIAVLLILLNGCNVSIGIGGNSIRGTGEMVSRSIEVGDFTAIDISGNYIIIYRQSPERALTAVMQENLFDHMDVNMRGNTLQVGSRRSFDTSTANRPRLYIYAPYLASADFSGAVNATNWDTIEGQSFYLDVSGAANVNLDINVERIEIDASGAANIDLSGTANTINIDGSGALNISAGSLQIQSGRIDVSGAANVTLSTLENVDVNASGVARVRAAN